MLWGMHLLVCVCVSSFLLPVPVLLAFPFFYDDDDAIVGKRGKKKIAVFIYKKNRLSFFSLI